MTDRAAILDLARAIDALPPDSAERRAACHRLLGATSMAPFVTPGPGGPNYVAHRGPSGQPLPSNDAIRLWVAAARRADAATAKRGRPEGTRLTSIRTVVMHPDAAARVDAGETVRAIVRGTATNAAERGTEIDHD